MPLFTDTYYHTGTMRTVTVNYTGPFFDCQTSRKALLSAIFGGTALHGTSKAKNPPQNSIGYVHDYSSNTLYALESMTSDTTTAGTPAAPWTATVVILRQGHVNKGMHIF